MEENVKWSSVSFGNKKYLALGSKTKSTGVNEIYIGVSGNGVNWNSYNLNYSFTNYSNILFKNNFYFSILRSGENVIYSSSDGNNFKEISRIPIGSIVKLSYVKDKFYAITSSEIYYSTNNCQSWNKISENTPNKNYSDINFDKKNNKFLLISNNKLYSSSNGLTSWKEIHTFSNNGVKTILINEEGVAIFIGTFYSYYSKNYNEEIVELTIREKFYPIKSCYYNDVFIIMAVDNYYSQNKIYLSYSFDGKNWSENVNIPTTYPSPPGKPDFIIL